MDCTGATLYSLLIIPYLLKNLQKTKGKRKMFEFENMMLGRLKSDCDYYLGNGYGFEAHLWAGTVEEQIEKMKELFNIAKPEWITAQQIENYRTKMMMVKTLKTKIQEEFMA